MFTKQDHVPLERESGRIGLALDRQSCRTDVQLDPLELEEVTWGWKELKMQEPLRK